MYLLTYVVLFIYLFFRSVPGAIVVRGQMDGFSDDYVLTPLPEADDPEEPTGAEDDESAVAAEDYVQSLVTIESNWANGKTFDIISFAFAQVHMYNGPRLRFIGWSFRPDLHISHQQSHVTFYRSYI